MIIKIESLHKSDIVILYSFLDVGLKRALKEGHVQDFDTIKRLINILERYRYQMEDERNV